METLGRSVWTLRSSLGTMGYSLGASGSSTKTLGSRPGTLGSSRNLRNRWPDLTAWSTHESHKKKRVSNDGAEQHYSPLHARSWLFLLAWISSALLQPAQASLLFQQL